MYTSAVFIDKIKGILKEILTEEKYNHSLSVAKMAAELAAKYSPGLKAKAYIAGLVHDNARCLSNAEMLEEAGRRGLTIRPVERSNPVLLHSIVGSMRISGLFGIDDPEIQSAVASHTLGKCGASILDQIIFVSDAIEERRVYPLVESIRVIMLNGLEQLTREVTRAQIMYVVASGLPLAEETVDMYNEITLNSSG